MVGDQLIGDLVLTLPCGREAKDRVVVRRRLRQPGGHGRFRPVEPGWQEYPRAAFHPAQLAKQLWPQGGGLAGALEAGRARAELSPAYSKPRILEMYLSAIYGNGCVGDS